MFWVACVVSFIPFILLYLWVRNGLKSAAADGAAYQKLCGKALLKGFLSIFPVMLFSGVSSVLLNLTGLRNNHYLIHQALYTMIVLALMEELAKFWMFRRLLKKNDYPYSWLSMIAFMTIVSIGFGAIESVVYAIDASIPVVLVRGICVPHVGYGFVEGYFYGKAVKTGKMGWQWLGLCLSWVIHGLYDFSLTPELLEISDIFYLLPFILVIIDIWLAIHMVVFTKKARKQEKYTERL